MPAYNDRHFRARFAPIDYGRGVRMAIMAEGADGKTYHYRMERVALDHFAVIDDDQVLMMPEREMREFLQGVVDHAAELGISANGSVGALKAKDENLADLRGIVSALLPRAVS